MSDELKLFNRGIFILHSGLESDWKIDCDALTDEDMEVIAMIGSRIVGTFIDVYGVPTGGTRLADKMRKYAKPSAPAPFLVVDDVCTTGKSLQDTMDKFGPGAKGFVIFCRGFLPVNAKALFNYSG